ITMKSTHENRDRKRRYSSSDDESRQSRFSVRPNNDDHRTKSPVEKRAKRSDQAEDRHCENRRRHDKSRTPERSGWDAKDRRDHRGGRRYDKSRTSSPTSKRSDGSSKLKTPDSTTDNRNRDSSAKSPNSQRSRSSKTSYRKSESPKIDEAEKTKHMSVIDRRNSRIVSEIEEIEKSPTPLRDENEGIATFSFKDACGPAPPNKASIWESDGESQEESANEEKSKSGSGQHSSKRETSPDTPDHMLDKVFDSSDDETEDAKYDTTPPPEELNAMTDEEKTKYTSAMEMRKRRRREQAISKLPVYYPGLHGCQHISEYHILNKIAAGTYGEVFRGKHTRTDEIVALKRFKMENEEEGFPITSLREINMLLKAGDHENVVNVKEVLLGRTVSEVYMAMEYIENDVKNWIDKLKHKGKRFRTGHTKNLVRQLLRGMSHLHDLWILHRDLKTANILISSSGVLKIADFGLAREYGEANDIETRMKLTEVVVTLWYRSPELLLQPKTYSAPVDMWSVGCIMAEFILMDQLFKGCDEPNQVDLIFRMMGTPSEKTWPAINKLRIWQTVNFPVFKPGELRRKFLKAKLLDESGFDLLNGLLKLDPSQRLTAAEALEHPWFNEYPECVPNKNLPLIQADGNLAPAAGHEANHKSRLEKLLENEDPERAELLRQFNVKADQVKASNFQLK
ncbi:Protein CBG17235, partial [Caenorhabditis briggsae]